MYSIPKQAPQAPRVLTRANGKTRQNDAFPAILDDVEISVHIHSKPSGHAVNTGSSGSFGRARSGRAGRKTDFRTALKMARTEVELGPWLREFLEAPAVQSASEGTSMSTGKGVEKPSVVTDRALPVSVLVSNSPLANGPQMSLKMPVPHEINSTVGLRQAGLGNVGIGR